MAKAVDIKGAIREAKKLIEDVQRMDGNEAETRRRVERIFETVMEYDAFKHLSREYAVHGVGDTEHMDFAIKIDSDKISMVVELKRVNIDLSKNHLKQGSRYAIDMGCEWMLLTNGRQWELYHIEFGQPPEIRLIKGWNILHDELSDLIEHFELISLRSLKKNVLNEMWRQQSALTPEWLLAQILSEGALRYYKNSLRKETGVSIRPEDIVSAIRGLLNEKTGTIVDQMRISLPERKPQPKRAKKSMEASEQVVVSTVLNPSIETETEEISPVERDVIEGLVPNTFSD